VSDNLFNFKKRYRPEWYTDGPVKIYTPEEIADWEKNRDPAIDMKLSMQENLSVEDIKFLDGLKEWQAEDMMQDLMEGVSEGSDVEHKGFVA
jgi:hypothetical protein